MDQTTWNSMSHEAREKVRDNSNLSPQLIGLERMRVEVETTYGETRRFWVGKSTGWKPIHLEVKTTRSLGGDPAARAYKSVRVVRTSR